MTISQLASIEIYHHKDSHDLLATVAPLPFVLRFKRNMDGRLRCIGHSKTYPQVEKLDPLDCEPDILSAMDFDAIYEDLEKEIQFHNNK